MKEAIIILFVILAPIVSRATEISLVEIRNLFYQASEDSESAHELNEILLDTFPSGDLTLQGYKGMSLMLLAKYSYNPYKKLNYFNQGKSILDEAIKEDSDNIELRYLRYSVQCEAPMILNYKYSLSEDLSFIKTHLKSIKDLDLKTRINNFLEQQTLANSN